MSYDHELDAETVIYGSIIMMIVLIISIILLLLLHYWGEYIRGSEYNINISSISFVDNYEELITNKYCFCIDELESNDSALYVIDINGNVNIVE